jgi:hypothetical protein
MFGGKSTPQLYLSAFGKHPGWNDHIDDLGLDTQALIAVKRLLYVQGINQNIDAGAWENPDVASPEAAAGAARLADFRHDFFWYLPPASTADLDPALVAGRIWSSVDGKGRAKYPMVLAAQTTGLSDSFALRLVLPTLAKVNDRCAAAHDADTVRQTVDAARAALRSKLPEPPAPENLTALQLSNVASHPDMHPDREGFHRIIYAFLRTLSAYRPGVAGPASSKRPEQIRVPLAGLTPTDALAFWLRVSLSLLDPNTPILLLAPDPAITGPAADAATAPGWIDILVGEPSPQNLFAIKAGPKSVPLTSDIPYTLEPAIVSSIENYLQAVASLPPDAPPPALPLS